MSFVLTAQNGTALKKTSRTKIENLVLLLEKDLINSLTFRFGSRLKTSCRKHAKNKQRTIKWAYIWVTTTQAELSLYVASRDNQLYNNTRDVVRAPQTIEGRYLAWRIWQFHYRQEARGFIRSNVQQNTTRSLTQFSSNIRRPKEA